MASLYLKYLYVSYYFIMKFLLLSYANFSDKMQKLFIYNRNHYNGSCNDISFILIVIFCFDQYLLYIILAS